LQNRLTKTVEMITDEWLMVQVQNDDLDYLKDLFERYQVRLYNFFLRMTFDQDVSDDLVQNVFMRLMKYRKSFNPEYKFKTWVYQMARNVHHDHYRKNKQLTDDFKNVENVADLHHSDEEDEINRERESVLFQALDKMPEDKRELIVLGKLEGMKYEEIAEIRNTTVGNIKVQMHRAIQQLREIYFDHAEN
jgi:RNA polymerase sigma factor (sigma-70 family)